MNGLPIRFQMVASGKRVTCPDADERRIEIPKMQDLESMTSLQLRAVIAELRPLEVHDLVERDHEVLAARQTLDSLSEQLRQAGMEATRADRQIINWRAVRPLLARMHDLGLLPSRFVGERAAIKARAETRAIKLAVDVSRAEERVRKIQNEIEAGIRRKQAPIREYMAELERLERKKALYEVETGGQWQRQEPDNAVPATETPSFKRLSAR